MPCYKPIKGYKCSDGTVVFSQLARHDIIGDIKLPCAQCIGCRLDRAREWSVRCMHEAKMHDENCFITLTYKEENLPANNSLQYSDFQKFLKRLRHHSGPIRYFMCGEYGEQLNRPHYHAIIFGYQFPDRYYWGKSPAGYPLYRSELLETLWDNGISLIGSVTRESAGYVARYCLKKINGDLAAAHYGDREPEFAHMSLKPGIGASFFKKYTSDILPNDYVVSDGWKIPVPKYYDKLYKGDLEDVKWEREKYAKKFAANNTPERLEAREVVQHAKIKSLQRNKI